ncbi:DUF4350 domain-containing protein [Micromonospora sp. HM5-17]|uniref:DUF4350 domain-containing protein n=1 Tax=Micromonospora sp. HM5-17 TaxID=2487710 RepID=UPI0018F2B041|nr:DUF4350 domain-containing protein [Micromonospora sp. HM5-17]
MTTPTAAAARPRRIADQARRRRRWHRLTIPLGVAALLLAVTGITHAIDQPDPESPGFLSPVSTDDVGGSRLAAELRDRGVTIERMTSIRRALSLATSEGFTLFVPAPGLVHRAYWPLVVDPAENARVVLVDPPRQVLAAARVPLAGAGRRWAARAVPAETDGQPCPLPELGGVGPAAVLLQRYADPPGRTFRADRCYAGGVARTRWRGNDLVVVGASDPFRNDRIDEWHNAALVTNLLAVHGRVVWLDLDGPEPPPPSPPDGERESTPPPESGGPYDEGTYDHGDVEVPGGGEYASPPSTREPQAERPQRGNPLWDALPAWFWAMLVQLAVALLLLALWRGRRLGPPVAEPLPVTVPAAETALGRGRLYHRARAYGPTAELLRAAALHRLRRATDRVAGSRPAEVVAAVAARTGQRPEDVHHLLYGPAPTTNQELLDLARALDRLAPSASPVQPVSRQATPPDHHPSVPFRPDRPVEGETR